MTLASGVGEGIRVMRSCTATILCPSFPSSFFLALLAAYARSVINVPSSPTFLSSTFVFPFLVTNQTHQTREEVRGYRRDRRVRWPLVSVYPILHHVISSSLTQTSYVTAQTSCKNPRHTSPRLTFSRPPDTPGKRVSPREHRFVLRLGAPGRAPGTRKIKE